MELPIERINKTIDEIISQSKGYDDKTLLDVCSVVLEDEYDFKPKKHYGKTIHDPIKRRKDNPPIEENFSTILTIEKVMESYKKHFSDELNNRMLEILKEGFEDQIKELCYLEEGDNISNNGYFDDDETEKIAEFVSKLKINISIE